MDWEMGRQYCVNCGTLLIGFKDKIGRIKFRCNRCGVKAISKAITRRHKVLDVYAPKEEEN